MQGGFNMWVKYTWFHTYNSCLVQVFEKIVPDELWPIWVNPTRMVAMISQSDIPVNIYNKS